MSKLRALLTFGTRPEAVKMAPVVHECRRSDQIEPIVKALLLDKKMLRGELRFVLPEGLGRARIVATVAPEMIRRVLRDLASTESAEGG